jgi:hypothetical protein
LKFKVDGAEYPVPFPLTLGEMRDVKDITGLNMAQVEAGFGEMDPHAFLGVLCVAIHRVTGEPIAEIAERLNATELTAIQIDLEDAEVEADPPVPAGDDEIAPGAPEPAPATRRRATSRAASGSPAT